MVWTAIAITVRFGECRKSVENEIRFLQKQAALPADIPILVVEDACSNVGSCGSTLNALLVLVEYLCAQNGFTVLNERPLKSAKLLIVHLSRPFVFDPRGAAFLDLNTDFVSPTGFQLASTPFLHQLQSVTMFAIDAPLGVWICDLDFYWTPIDGVPLRWPASADITVFTLPVTSRFARNHGVYSLDRNGQLMDIVYRGSIEALEKVAHNTDALPLVLALMHLSVESAEHLLSLHSRYPLSGSTYLGMDNGWLGLKLSLFFDFLLPTCTDISESVFLNDRMNGDFSKCENRPEKMDDLKLARRLIWKCFSPLCCSAACLNVVAIVIFPNTVDCHTDVRIRVHNGNAGPFLGRNLSTRRDLDLTSVKDLQNHLGDAHSMQEVLEMVNIDYYFRSAREHKVNVWLADIGRILKSNSHKYVLAIFRTICSLDDNFYVDALLKLLNDVALESTSEWIPARTLSCIADVLSILALNQGGLRSGPAANEQFLPALVSLHSPCTTRAGLIELEKVAKKWMNTPMRLMRAARHYDAASQVFICRTIVACKTLVNLDHVEPVDFCRIFASSRIDIAGGWSDTPPITYEYGGSVLNIAIKIDDKKPVSCTCTKLYNATGVHMSWKSGSETEFVLFSSIDEILKVHNRPSARGSLICAVLVTGVLIDENPHSKKLEDILFEKLGPRVIGLHLTTESLIPHGSGLGTSSIMAGCLLAALWMVMGRKFDQSALIHGVNTLKSAFELPSLLVLSAQVLCVEQVLTTGGGWQDQVGGLIPGVKIGRFSPISGVTSGVTVETLDISKERIADLNVRLAVIYTGRTRLAKNLLQEVIRNWFARQNHIVHTVIDLVSNAEDCVKAVKRDDWATVSKCARLYWQQKKQMAPGCEPWQVADLMEILYDKCIAEAAWLAGAGGAGFMYVLLKDRDSLDKLKLTIEQLPAFSSMTVHSVEIDMDPLVIETMP